MKNKPYIILPVVSLMVMVSCAHVNSAELTVRPDASLTNEEVDAKLASYYAVPDRDAMPNDAAATAFRANFAGAVDVEWEVANDIYKVEFELSRADYKAWYDETGCLLMYAFDIAKRAVPRVVTDALSQKYPQYRIDDAAKIFKGTEELYELSIEKGKQELKVYFKNDGAFVRETWD